MARRPETDLSTPEIEPSVVPEASEVFELSPAAYMGTIDYYQRVEDALGGKPSDEVLAAELGIETREAMWLRMGNEVLGYYVGRYLEENPATEVAGFSPEVAKLIAKNIQTAFKDKLDYRQRTVLSYLYGIDYSQHGIDFSQRHSQLVTSQRLSEFPTEIWRIRSSARSHLVSAVIGPTLGHLLTNKEYQDLVAGKFKPRSPKRKPLY